MSGKMREEKKTRLIFHAEVVQLSDEVNNTGGKPRTSSILGIHNVTCTTYSIIQYHTDNAVPVLCQIHGIT
jgi:hypothetical protein